MIGMNVCKSMLSYVCISFVVCMYATCIMYDMYRCGVCMYGFVAASVCYVGVLRGVCSL